MTAAVNEAAYEGPELELAPQGRRLGAFVLDFLLFIFTLGIGWLIWLAVVGQRGQNPAKQLLGMHVVLADGNRAGLGRMLLREIIAKWGTFALLDYVLGFADQDVAGWVTLAAVAVAALWCVWDANRQCLWDKALGTYVVRQVDGPVGARATTAADRAAENLETLQDLHNRGLLTDEEFEERRAREVDRL